MTISEFNKEILPAIILGIIYSCIEISVASHIVKPFTYFFIAYLIMAEIISFPVEGEDFLYAKKSFLVKDIIVSLSVFSIFAISEYGYENFKIIGLINAIFFIPRFLSLSIQKAKSDARHNFSS